MTLAAIVLITIAFVALIGYYEFRISTMDRAYSKLAASRKEWRDYARTLNNENDDLWAYCEELKRELRKYSPIIVDYKIAKNQVSAHKVATTGFNGTSESTYALTLPLMPELPSDSKLELSPMVLDDNGMVLDNGGTLRAVKIAPIAASTNGNGKASKAKDTTSSKVDNSKASDSSKRDSGSFEFVDTNDYDALAKKYAANKKYNEFVAKINKAHKGNRTQNQTNYLLAKFDQWERKPNTTDEYCKRVTSDHMNKNK